ncbi:amidohydrolase family protein [Paenibacillus sp. FSL H7-0326]|uniref:amidohydrolase family protein n=1 Tax=Paenibacillus sp. FSL H7-0326 TaxID=1921144 RepID=UPI00118013F7|nr:amidohydrolase family protein [Paenibacillus sp. FSL H7-0326]
MIMNDRSEHNKVQIIYNCRLPEQTGFFDVTLRGEHIEQVSSRVGEDIALESVLEEDLISNERKIDARGRLLIPGLIEPHIHMEKAMLLHRMPKEAASLQEAIAMTVKLKEGFTKQDMIARSLDVAYRINSYGVTTARCHVEVDPVLGLSAIESLLEVKDRVSDRMDLNIVAFPQEGIYAAPGTAELMKEAVKLGADAVGGITYMDPDLDEHLSFVFRLAAEYDLPLDFHADFSLDPCDRGIMQIARRTKEFGYEGRVAAGHVTSLGAMPREEAVLCAQQIAESGVHIITLPATDLYMNGRQDTDNVRRGLTPVRLLLEQGVNVLYGANNIRNAFTPFGTGNVMDIAWLLAHTAYMGSENDAKLLVKMGTTLAAQVLGMFNYRITAGQTADLALFPVASERELLIERPKPLAVWKNGKMLRPIKTAEDY